MLQSKELWAVPRVIGERNCTEMEKEMMGVLNGQMRDEEWEV